MFGSVLNGKCLWCNVILFTAMLLTLRQDERRLCNCLPQCDDVNFAVDSEEQIEWQVKKRNCNLNERLRTKQQQLNTTCGFWFMLPRYCGTSVRTFGMYILSPSSKFELVLESGTLYNGRVKETCRVESRMGEKRTGFWEASRSYKWQIFHEI